MFFEIEVDGIVYALDSTTIDLCLSIFWWAKFRKHKGGIKLHTLYDVKTSIPSFLYITNAIVHDVNIMDLKASEIAFLYKKRWAAELFLKWMKQHLKIKSFWGTTLNAVKIQMYCAVIAYCLVAINSTVTRCGSKYPGCIRWIAVGICSTASAY